MSKKALLLIGSPNGEKSTSGKLGMFLADRLREQGMDIDSIVVSKAIKSEAGIERLISGVDAADIVILSAPLYIDQFPSFVIRSMELIYEHKNAMGVYKKQRFLAIVNCGFPEAHQNVSAAAISRHFGLQSGLDWAGCLCIGMGPVVGELFQRSPVLVGKLRKGLKLTADALSRDGPVPAEAMRLVSSPLMPLAIARHIVYPIIMGRIWDSRARANGALDKIRDRPYGNYDGSGGAGRT